MPVKQDVSELIKFHWIIKKNTEVICQKVFGTCGRTNPKDIFCGMLTVCYKSSWNSVWCSKKIKKKSLKIGKIFRDQERLYELLKCAHMYKKSDFSVKYFKYHISMSQNWNTWLKQKLFQDFWNAKADDVYTTSRLLLLITRSFHYLHYKYSVRAQYTFIRFRESVFHSDAIK